jgi:hypothetical protein
METVNLRVVFMWIKFDLLFLSKGKGKGKGSGEEGAEEDVWD